MDPFCDFDENEALLIEYMISWTYLHPLASLLILFLIGHSFYIIFKNGELEFQLQSNTRAFRRKKRNEWINEYKKKNPEMSYKDVMKLYGQKCNTQEIETTKEDRKINIDDISQTFPEEKIINIYKNHMPKYVDTLIFNISSYANTGACQRTAEIFNVGKFYYCGAKKIDPRGAVGATTRLNVVHLETMMESGDKYNQPIVNMEEFDQFIEENDYYPIIIEQGGKNLSSISWNEYNSKNVLLIFGNESFGVPQSVINHCLKKYNSIIISIEQSGFCRSLNISNAYSIILYEFNRNIFKNKYIV